MSKTTYVAALPLIVWLAAAWRWNGAVSDNIGLLIAGAASTLFAIWYILATHRFAEKNPALALLEGAELLEWQRTEAAVKGVLPTAGQRPQIELNQSGEARG